MKTLICGSIAYDTILNVAFLVPDMRREFGGCAGNIAYNLKLLGGEPLIMATIGDDSAPYMHRLKQLGLDARHVTDVPGSFTAQAFITTDLDDNQITAFHPGAMTQSQRNKVTDARDVSLGIISPDGRDGMLQHAREFNAARIPFIFDPGQGLPMFDGEDLMDFLKLADYCTVNDYEAQLLTQRTGRTLEQLAGEVEALIVTLGGSGSHIYTNGRRIEIPVAIPEALIDPTGCGDAYRAGLLYGIGKGWDWEKTGRLASLMGSIKIAHRGGQNHKLKRDDIATRYSAEFGDKLW